jgi:hypothetical protein
VPSAVIVDVTNCTDVVVSPELELPEADKFFVTISLNVHPRTTRTQTVIIIYLFFII